MKTTFRALLAASLCLLTGCNVSTNGGDVYLSDFLDSASAESDAVPAIRAAVAYCAKTGASRLVLPGGELRLRPDRAEEKYQFISNNDESLKRIAFDLEGMRDFTIEGAGTKLLFSGFISPFNLERCRNVTIRDLSIDYTRTFHSEGIVRAAGPGWLDVEFPGEYVCDLSDGMPALSRRRRYGISVFQFAGIRCREERTGFSCGRLLAREAYDRSPAATRRTGSDISGRSESRHRQHHGLRAARTP